MRIARMLCGGLLASTAWTFSFRQRGEKGIVHGLRNEPRQDLNLSPIEMLQSGSRPPNVYAVALHELQDLESEPLCHRIAARLLIGNCQLLDGKDEATILTDSGRQIRDFVDSYAASMAICDLERGRFGIPPTCDKFREPILAKIPFADTAQLHVTSREIDLCLSGLAGENSAWSTWVSYRHKALRFCEAARVDQEKTQNILLYQKLTKVMAKLTHGVEIELQKHMDNLQFRMNEAADRVHGLKPEVDRLRARLISIEDTVIVALEDSLRQSGDMTNTNVQDAANLQRMIAAMVQAVLEGTSHVAATQERSIQLARQNHEDNRHWAKELATATASAITLNNHLEVSRLEMHELSQQQHMLSSGLDRLTMVTSDLLSTYSNHSRALDEAKNMTADLLITVAAVADNLAAIEDSRNSSLYDLGISHWMPYIVSPIATLLLGSYGLAPSAIRNLSLVALGEVVGFVVSHIQRLTMSQVAIFVDNTASNKTMASPQSL